MFFEVELPTFVRRYHGELVRVCVAGRDYYRAAKKEKMKSSQVEDISPKLCLEVPLASFRADRRRARGQTSIIFAVAGSMCRAYRTTA